MDKKAQAQIIVSVLLILIAMMSVIFGGIMIFKYLNKGSQDIQDKEVISNIEIKQAIYNGSDILLSLQNNGDSDINSLKIIFSDGFNSESFDVSDKITARNLKTFNLNDFKELDILRVNKVSITPILNNKPGSSIESKVNNFKEKSGAIGDDKLNVLPHYFNIVAYWKLDGDAKDVVSGIVGTPNNLLFKGQDVLENSEKFAEFNGVDSYIDLRSPNELKFTEAQPFSICAWVNTTKIGGEDYGRIFSAEKTSGALKGYRLFYNKWDEFVFEIATSTVKVTLSNIKDENNWGIVCGVYDPVNYKQKIYYKSDKKNIKREIQFLSLPNPDYSDITFSIGANKVSNIHNKFKGNLDEIIIYNLALGDDDVTALMEYFSK